MRLIVRSSRETTHVWRSCEILVARIFRPLGSRASIALQKRSITPTSANTERSVLTVATLQKFTRTLHVSFE